MLVFPLEPVIPTTVSAGIRSTTERASLPRASTESSTTTHGTSSSREARTAAAPDAIAAAARAADEARLARLMSGERVA